MFSNWSKTSCLEYLSLTPYIGPHTFILRNSWHAQNPGNWQNLGISLKISKLTEFQSSLPLPINAAPLKWGLPAVLSAQFQLPTIYYSASFHSSSLPEFTRVLSESQPSQTPPPPIPILKLPNPRPLPPGYSPPHPAMTHPGNIPKGPPHPPPPSKSHPLWMTSFEANYKVSKTMLRFCF